MSASPLHRLFRLAKRRPAVEREVDDEIDYHLDATTRELIASGLDPTAARAEARRRFGDVERVRATLGAIDRDRVDHEVRAERWRDVSTDLWQAVRGLFREPAFTATVALTLALGIGANATMFGVVDRLLLRPPPFVKDDGRLSLIYFQRQTPEFGLVTYRSASYPAFENLRARHDIFDDVAAWWRTEFSLGRGTEARKVAGMIVTPNLFPLLGVHPVAGRFLTSDEWNEPAVNPVILSGGFAEREFGSAQAALGHSIELNMISYVVTGVAPRGFTGPRNLPVDVFVPFSVAAASQASPRWRTTNDMRWLEMVAHLRSGNSAASAGAAATVAHQQFGRAAKKGDSTVAVVAGPMIQSRGPEGSTQAKVALWLSAVSGIVLLIACANVANLLLARATRRRRELAVRLALGVARRRLVLQLLAESLTLAVLGGLAALLIAYWGSVGLRATLLRDIAWEDAPIDGRVALFTTIVIVVTGVLAGLAPALTSSRSDLTESLKAGTREGGGRRSRLRSALIMTQAALSVALLVGAGLFAMSFRRATTLDLGFVPDHLVFARPELSTIAKTPEEYEERWRAAVERVRSLPGVVNVSQSVTTPFESQWQEDLYLPESGKVPPLKGGGPYQNGVSPEFFPTLGARLLRGRTFSPTDDVKGAAPVVLINNAMARAVWPNQDPLGRCFRVAADTAPCTTIVGVVADARVTTLSQPAAPQYFLPLGQWAPDMRVMFVRVSGVANDAVTPIRRTLSAMSSALPYTDVRAMSEIMEPELRSWRLGATMFSIFGLLAFIVAIVGTYSVVAYDVTQRRREIGVRMALGARRSHVLRDVVGHGLRTTGWGVGVGLLLAFVSTPLLATLLFETSPRDPAIFLSVAGVLILAAAAASLLPARQAARTDPARVLRSE
ncbi:MAG: ABC transporter permease [Gemmatimonadaceae bacterium]